MRKAVRSILFLAAMLFAVLPAQARELELVRDAEIESTIRTWAAPVFRAAGLEASAIKVHLVKDPSLNAFVAGGLHMFINTGLLVRSEHAGQVIGVLAHETGHIAAGHLSRTRQAMEDFSAQNILAMVLGGAAVLAGRGDVGTAVLQGGSSMGLAGLLAYSRTQEAAADQAAARYLEQTGQSAEGLKEFMEVLGEQELLSPHRQDPYLRTHPISADRVAFLRQHVSTAKHSGTAFPPEFVEMHARMKAKLIGFLEPAERTLRRYSADDPRLEARYARAIAQHMHAETAAALATIDGLLAERPRDPWFLELKGQILFESGRPAESVPPYTEAVRLAPESALLRIALARSLLEQHDPTLFPQAIEHLEAAVREEPRNSFAWRQLGIVHGRAGDVGRSSLALAEEAYVLRRRADAAFQAERAARNLPQGSREWLRAQDILRALETMKE